MKKTVPMLTALLLSAAVCMAVPVNVFAEDGQEPAIDYSSDYHHYGYKWTKEAQSTNLANAVMLYKQEGYNSSNVRTLSYKIQVNVASLTAGSAEALGDDAANTAGFYVIIKNAAGDTVWNYYGKMNSIDWWNVNDYPMYKSKSENTLILNPGEDYDVYCYAVDSSKTVLPAEAEPTAFRIHMPDSGTCGDDMTWEYEDHSLYIQGSGDMSDFDEDSADTPWRMFSDEITSVQIGDGAQTVGDEAFAGCVGLQSVSLPDTLTEIGEKAFDGCSKLQNVTFPDTLTEIGSSAFEDCESLKTADLSDTGVSEISSSVFLDCSGLSEAELPAKVTTIGDGAFCGTSLQTITIPSSVASIGSTAFCRTSLKAVTIPSSVKSIGSGAFSQCAQLSKVTFKTKKLKTISSELFAEDDKLVSLTIPEGVTTIRQYAFASNSLRSLTLPSTLTTVSDRDCTFKTLWKSGDEDGDEWGLELSWCKDLTIYGPCDNAVVKGLKESSAVKCRVILQHKPGTKDKTKCSVCGATIIKSAKLSYTTAVYSGKVKKPTVTVKNAEGDTLINGTDYTLTYASGRKYVGKYSVKITYKGAYSGTKYLYFTIKPGSTYITKLTATTGGFKAYWHKQSLQITGYNVQYSTSSSFTSAKSLYLTGSSTLSKSVTKLTKGKKYYVRVRVYKTVNGTKYYSSWSKTKYVTTKK